MSEFKFSMGETVLDLFTRAELVVIDKHIQRGQKQYECKDNRNYIHYRMENKLDKQAITNYKE